MKTRLKAVTRRLSTVPLLGAAARRTRVLCLRWSTPFVIRSYLRAAADGKLHLGAGSGSGLPGWLNTDLCPGRWPTVRLDVTRRFPLPDAAFAYAFSEHMIEHVPLAAARRMLGECYRVLRPGGWIRIATPDLARVVRLHGAIDPAPRRYLDWALRHNRLPDDLPSDAVVINSLFHDHGHRFLYDEPTLAAVLIAAGFSDPRRCAPGESSHPELRGLEVHHTAVGHDANNFETLVLEARKP